MRRTSTGHQANHRARVFSVTAAALLLAGAATGCGSSAASTPSGASAAEAATTATLPAETVVIDVRTPQEYSAGHLRGAQNIDLSSASFPSQIAALPKSGTYVVYCRSGNRSATAVAQMKAAGFTNVKDAGGLQQASSATGLPVVT